MQGHMKPISFIFWNEYDKCFRLVFAALLMNIIVFPNVLYISYKKLYLKRYFYCLYFPSVNYIGKKAYLLSK